jgi:hypothetical protein
VVGLEQWAEVRRLHFVKGLSQREIRRRTGLLRDRKALNSKGAAGLSACAGGVEADITDCAVGFPSPCWIRATTTPRR